MQSMSASDFRKRLPKILEDLPEEGISLTSRGRAVARVVPERENILRFLGAAPEMIVSGDIMSTGILWDAEWKDPDLG